MSKQMEKATEESGFLDGRDYTAAFLYEFFSMIVGNGIYANELAPTATNENMTITHGAGHAWINGVCYKNTTPFVLDIATADGILNRFDSLMLRLNLSINEVYAIIVQGNYATNPTPPAVTRNAETFDLKICDIYIPAGCTKITQAQITDTRLDSSVCGVPVFPVEHLDMTTFYKQVAVDLDNLKQKEQEEILALLNQLNYLVESDTVGKLIADINKKISRDGSTPITANLPMGGHKVTDLGAPTSDNDAVNLGYINKNFRPNTWMPTADQVGAAPASHVSDSANPHKVTAAQVGARPDTWMPTASEVGAAPGGYGLGIGSTSKNVTAITGNGWYVTNQDTPDGAWWLCFAMVTNNGRDITVEAWNLTGTVKCKRTKRSDVWGDWEYVNPPMALGTEYRTTERHNGKVVYAKHYNAGTFTNNGYVSLPSGAVEILRYEGWFGSSKRLLPIGRYGDSGANYYAYLAREVSGDSKVLYTYQKGFTDGANTLYITAYYTKD